MKSAALTQKQIKKLPAHAFSRAEYYEKGQLKDVYFTPDLRRTSPITVERMLQRLRARALKSKYAIKILPGRMKDLSYQDIKALPPHACLNVQIWAEEDDAWT